jgi:hypothetical protein
MLRGFGILCTVSAVLLAGAALCAQDQPTKSANPHGRVYPLRVYTTTRLTGPAPVIDGHLDDAAWSQGEWTGDYRQQMPAEGAPPTKPTQFKILYDDRNIYVAIRAFDDPALIHRYGARRDVTIGSGDVVGIAFDSYNDKRTGFEFDLSVAGGKTDIRLGNYDFDNTWNAVWDGKTAVEENAWTAEFRIPLSQLRYSRQAEQVWGLHAWRWIDRNQESDQWDLIPRNSTGRMHNLGELRGIDGLKRFRRFELLPYTLARGTLEPEVPGDPYRGASGSASAGLDLKAGLTTNFTLDATINPDFGQVEADPSVINLTTYETFYPEKRPFFLEGKNIYQFDLDPSFEPDILFYSRRIGGAPAYSPSLVAGEAAKLPEMTTILDAVKITGKSNDGLSLGILQSLTSDESARISYQGSERRQTVEPFTHYFLSRVQKDWDKGNTILGGMLTSTHRWINDPQLEFLPANALTGGLDFARYFHKRTFVLESKGVFSRVSGSADAIEALQTNAVHLFQRPDADHLGVNPAATSLSGHGGRIHFGTTENSKWRFGNSFRWSSPGLELNDLGYLRQADFMSNDAMLGYQESEPRGIFRRYAFELRRTDRWDFGGLRTQGQTELEASAGFRNKWSARGSFETADRFVDTRLLRGGPAVAFPHFINVGAGGSTDTSRRLSFSMYFASRFFAEGYSRMTRYTPGITVRPANTLEISASAFHARNHNDLEYAGGPNSDTGSRYLLGRINQKTLGLTFRVVANLTPDLSIQYYASPFVSAGRYSDFKRATDSIAHSYEDRFHRLGPEEISYRPEANVYDVVEGNASYSFANPDFSFRQFRSNLVMRWEFTPGSSIYAVWSQGRTSQSSLWDPSLGGNFHELWDTPGQNIFMVKFSYWFTP